MQVTFTDKDKNQPISDPRRLVRDSDINELKAANNANDPSKTNGAFVENEVPSGSGTSFSLANTPVVGSVKLFRNGLRQVAPDDYSITGAAITLTSTIGSDTLLADYRKAT